MTCMQHGHVICTRHSYISPCVQSWTNLLHALFLHQLPQACSRLFLNKLLSESCGMSYNPFLVISLVPRLSWTAVLSQAIGVVLSGPQFLYQWASHCFDQALDPRIIPKMFVVNCHWVLTFLTFLAMGNKLSKLSVQPPPQPWDVI